MSTYSIGLRNVGSYQVSGHPFVTGSTIQGNLSSGTGPYNAQGEHKIQFPYVSQTILVENRASSADPLRLHFREQAAGNVIGGNHFVEIAAGTSVSVTTKCKEIYLSIAGTTAADKSNYVVVAELTNIQTGSMYVLTGSGITE